MGTPPGLTELVVGERAELERLARLLDSIPDAPWTRRGPEQIISETRGVPLA